MNTKQNVEIYPLLSVINSESGRAMGDLSAGRGAHLGALTPAELAARTCRDFRTDLVTSQQALPETRLSPPNCLFHHILF